MSNFNSICEQERLWTLLCSTGEFFRSDSHTTPVFVCICLTALGLSCRIFHLRCDIQDRLVEAVELLVVACGIQSLNQGLNPGPLHWECGVLSTGPPGKFHHTCLYYNFIIQVDFWRRKWQPTPVFLPGESQGRRRLVGCCLPGRSVSDTTEATQQQQISGVQIPSLSSTRLPLGPLLFSIHFMINFSISAKNSSL